MSELNTDKRLVKIKTWETMFKEYGTSKMMEVLKTPSLYMIEFEEKMPSNRIIEIKKIFGRNLWLDNKGIVINDFMIAQIKDLNV